MTRRWPALVVAALATVTPMLLLTSCHDDRDPTKPTITLVEPTLDPDVPIGTD